MSFQSASRFVNSIKVYCAAVGVVDQTWRRPAPSVDNKVARSAATAKPAGRFWTIDMFAPIEQTMRGARAEALNRAVSRGPGRV